MTVDIALNHSHTALNGLRPGWRTVKFGDVVRNVNVTVDAETSGLERYIAGEHMETDDLHIRRWGTIGDGYLGPAFHRKFVKGQILYGSRRTYLRKVAVADFDGICANTTFVLEPANDQLIPDLLPFIMQTESFVKHSMQQSRGSTNPYVTFKDLAWYEFPLPPIAEQRRIAEILWAADDNIEQLRRVYEALSDLRFALLDDYFNENQLGRGWSLIRLDNIAIVRTGIAKGKNYTNSALTELPYLSVLNVQDGYLDLESVKRISVPNTEIERYLLKKGDILLTEGGDPDKLGRGTVWKSEIDPCLHQNHVFCIRPFDNILPEFLSYQTGSPYGKKYFLSCAKQTTNLASINTSQVRAFPVLLPSITEQERILAELHTNAQSMNHAKTHIEHVVQLKQHLLASLLQY